MAIHVTGQDRGGLHEYAELHCHSAFSLLDGASTPEELVDRAVELKLSALALTDHDDMGGAVRFAHAAREAGLPAVIGAEITMDDESHLTLLAGSAEGYKNICRLITSGRMSQDRGVPKVRLEELAERSKGVVALSGCPNGAIPRLIASGKCEDARQAVERFREIYREDFWLEMWDHHTAQESLICREMLELSRRYGIEWLVTNNVHYASMHKRIIHDVLTCLRHNVTLSAAGTRLRPNGSWCLKSPGEMAYQWRHHPDGIRNTLRVAERCEFRLGALRPELPRIDVWQRIRRMISSGAEEGWKRSAPHKPAVDAVAEDPNAALELLAWKGARERYGSRLTEQHVRQIRHELDIIFRLDLSPYFLIMWDIVCFAESKGILVQGRGSAANSAVCYCLRITAVDPIGMDLLFERFISEDRNEPPDIDLDISHQYREIILQYVYEKYGREHAAMVCEHITYRGPSAVRDAARVFGLSPDQADRLSAESQYLEAGEAAEALRAGGALRAGLDPNDRRVRLLIEVVAGLDQLPRHRSIHVGGFVLSGEPLGCIVPVEPASMPGRTVIQWDKDDIDLAGLVKIDLLGLGMLTMIQDAVNLIRRHRGCELDLSQLDGNDPEVYEMLQRADTIGVFQVESRAQMSILPKIRPRCFYDIVVSIAIVRPGPIQGNIVHPYLRRRRGLEPVTYLHPSIEPILKRTLGVPLFQEQGMRLAVAAAGFTPSQADELRRVMSHKRSLARMSRLCGELARGMRANGLSEEAIETITFQLKAFANYGFPESHAASFALLVYASAYLKRYFASEFYCALLNAQPMGFYSPSTLVRDAMRHGVEVRPVDISRSSWDCTLEDTISSCDGGNRLALRIGLRYVSGLGRKARGALDAAWSKEGAFVSMEDVCQRSGLSTADLQKLASAGAFESFCPGRREAMWKLLKLSRPQREYPLLDFLEREREDSSPAFVVMKQSLDISGRTRQSCLEPGDVSGDRYLSEHEGELATSLGQAATLKPADLPGRASTLDSMDLPGRAATLESADLPGRAASLDSMDLPGRAATLDSMDLPEPAATLEPADLPEPAATLKSADLAAASSRVLIPGHREGSMLPPMTRLEETVADYRMLGLSTGCHPMAYYREWATNEGMRSCVELTELVNGERITVAGCAICRQRPQTAKGFVFITIEDETGTANIIVRPRIFERFKQVILENSFLAITGKLQLEEGVMNVITDRIAALPALTQEGTIPVVSRNFH